jgi:glycosyltransferase involved in cell wall biosynthesis
MPFFPLFSVKLVCLLKGKKMIATWHEVWGKKYWKEYLGNLGNIAYFIEKLSFLTPNKIISVSDHTTNKLKNELLSKKEIITIPDGIDFDHIQKIKPSVTKSDVVFTGRLLSHKNVNVLIKSIDILKEHKPDIKCLIIGDGPEKKQLEKMVTNLNLNNNVLFLGFIENHDEVYSLIKSSKVFVLPSTREGFGIVVIEANACGIPVITTNNKDNASKDLIEEGNNGDICRLNGFNISRKISNLLQKDSNNQVKQHCIDSVKKYDWKNIIKKIEEVYKK